MQNKKMSKQLYDSKGMKTGDYDANKWKRE